MVSLELAGRRLRPIIVLAATMVATSFWVSAGAWAQPASDVSGFWGRLEHTTPAGAPPPSAEERGFWRRTGEGVKTIWTDGGSDVFVPGYIWHMPWHYSDDQLTRYNRVAWGLGLGRTLPSDHNQPRTLYAMVSADSYSRPQYMVGYMWRARWQPGDGAFSIGAGYTAMLIGRHDRLRYTPLPIALPLASIGLDRFEIMGAYVPGFEVAYLFLKVSIGTSR